MDHQDRPSIDPAALALGDQGLAIAADKLDIHVAAALAFLRAGRDQIDVWSRLISMFEGDCHPKVVAALAAVAILRAAEGEQARPAVVTGVVRTLARHELRTDRDMWFCRGCPDREFFWTYAQAADHLTDVLMRAFLITEIP